MESIVRCASCLFATLLVAMTAARGQPATVRSPDGQTA